MTRISQGLLLALFGLLGAACSHAPGPAGHGDITPVVSPVYEVTDERAGHRIRSTSPENSTMVRVGGDLYFVYRTGGPEEGNRKDHETVFLRRFDLTRGRFDPAVRAFLQREHDPVTARYHFLPTLLRTGQGSLVPLHVWSGQVEESRDTDTLPPRFRIIGDLDRQSTWSPPLGQGRGLPSRLRNDHPAGARYQDLMGVFDPSSGVTHVVGEGARLGGPDSDNGCGLPRLYFRIGEEEEDIDGPHVLVQADCGQPEGVPLPCQSGNIFTKGDLVLGKGKESPRSLHLVWNIRNTFEKADPICGCDCETASYYQWNYNLYYAVSTDGGVSWGNVEGAASRWVAGEGGEGGNRPLGWNEQDFLVYEGPVNQTSERSFDVDLQDRPVLAIKTYVRGSGSVWHEGARRLPDNLDRENPPRYSLLARRWDGSGWVDSVIDDERDFFNAWTRVRVDAEGRIWVFVDGRPWRDAPDRRPRYTVSADGGASWSGWRPLGPVGTSPVSLSSYADPEEPAYHYLAWRQGRRLRFLRLQLTEPASGGS